MSENNNDAASSDATEKLQKKVPISEFEEQVESVEGISIFLRADPTTMVDSYDYVKRCPDDSTVQEWLNRRVTPRIGEDIAVKIIDGDLESPRRTSKRLSTLRKSYKDS